MSVELKVPSVGESITEVVIGEWLKSEGDWVQEDEIIVVVESDKVNLEVPSPIEGQLTKVLMSSGDTVGIGDLMAEITPGKAPAKAAPTTASGSSSESNEAPAAVMPAAQRLLSLNGLSASDVKATGPGGRLLKEDVDRHLAEVKQAPKKAKTAPAAPAPIAPAGERSEKRTRMTPLRKTVAKRLVEAQQNAALLTTFNEVDMSEIMSLRKSHQAAFVDKYGRKLGFMSFFVRAVVDGLRAFPALNAVIDGEEIVYRNYFDVGVAVGGGKGLVVPVIRNAEGLGLAQIEHTIADFGQRAKKNQLKLDELLGGTFSITNGGVYGSLLSTPIVNPPQSGILGMHGIKDRPIAVNGEVVIRPMMYLALTYDHRIVDGREAVGFLVRVKECIESPVRLLLEV
jgi:2-oxoglutarate dehydrogenase E2 component (dihydrolipoamide succinyltransferase)